MRKFYKNNPKAKKANGERIASFMRTKEARESASVRATRDKIWELSPTTGRGKPLPDLPQPYLDLYVGLRSKGLRAPERLRIAREQMASDARRSAGACENMTML